MRANNIIREMNYRRAVNLQETFESLLEEKEETHDPRYNNRRRRAQSQGSKELPEEDAKSNVPPAWNMEADILVENEPINGQWE
jgi:hypothetical protein